MLAQGWAWAKPYLENDYWEVLQKYNRLKPVPVHLSKELLEKAEKPQAELNAIQDDESEEYSEERVNQIEDRLEQIEAAQTEFTAEQKTKSRVIFTISHTGEPTNHYALVEGRAMCEEVPSR